MKRQKNTGGIKNACSSAGERPAGVTSEGEDLQTLQQETQTTENSGRRRDGCSCQVEVLGGWTVELLADMLSAEGLWVNVRWTWGCRQVEMQGRTADGGVGWSHQVK